MVRLRLLAAILALPPSACVAPAREAASDGWGNYKFGMTTDEVRAVRGASLSPPEVGEELGTRFIVVRALEPVSFDGRNYELFLYSTPQEQGTVRLAWIELVDERSFVSPLQCESDFQSALRGLEKRHGALSPPPPNIFEDAGVIAEEAKGLSNAVSKYALKRFEPSRGYALQARTVVGSMMISIEAKDGPLIARPAGECHLRVTYAAR